MIEPVATRTISPLQRIEQGRPEYASTQTTRQTGTGFADIFKSKLNPGLTFSAHARQRLAQRDIQLSDEQVGKLEAAVDKVAEKGGRESLVTMDDVVYLVSVPNRTVITAMDGESVSSNVFTNIDSAVFVK